MIGSGIKITMINMLRALMEKVDDLRELAQSCPTLCDPMDCSPRNSPGQNTGVGSQPFPSPGDLPNPGIEPRSPALQADSLPAELPGKPLVCVIGKVPGSGKD